MNNISPEGIPGATWGVKRRQVQFKGEPLNSTNVHEKFQAKLDIRDAEIKGKPSIFQKSNGANT